MEDYLAIVDVSRNNRDHLLPLCLMCVKLHRHILMCVMLHRHVLICVMLHRCVLMCVTLQRRYTDT